MSKKVHLKPDELTLDGLPPIGDAAALVWHEVNFHGGHGIPPNVLLVSFKGDFADKAASVPCEQCDAEGRTPGDRLASLREFRERNRVGVGRVGGGAA
jgi:hypothetical protein